MTDQSLLPKDPSARERSPIFRHVRRYLSSYVTLALGLTLTLAATAASWRFDREHDKRAFEQITSELRHAIAFRMEAYISALTQTRGLFAITDEVSPQTFGEYVQASGIIGIYPGVQGIGYAKRVRAEELEFHVRKMRRQGFPDYQIEPSHARPEYFSIVILEPLDWRNQRAIGYDMFTEPIRREAMDKARDSGTAALSGKVWLVQETHVDRQPGFLIYVPVYASDVRTQTVAERRDALRGFVYSPFRAGDLFDSIFAGTATILNNVRVSVYDGDAVQEDALLFRRADSSHDEGRLAKSLSLDVAGRPWTIHVETTPRFGQSGSTAKTVFSLIFGTVLSFLAFFFLKVSKDQTERVYQADRRFRSLFDTNVIGCYVKGFDGRVMEANDAFLESIGCTRAELEQGQLRWDAITPEEWLAQDASIIEQFRRTGRFGPHEKEYFHKDGHKVPMLIGGAGHPQEPAALTFALNLSRLKESERSEQAARKEAERLYQEAEHSSRLKDDFLATVSHELRTPLNVIIGHSEMLLKAKTQPDLIPYALKSIHRNAKAQAQIIEDLLDVSRIISGKLQLHVEPVSAAKIVADALSTVKLAADAKNIQITVHDDGTPGTVIGDPVKLQQVVWNLLSNAIKFSDVNGRIDVEIRTLDPCVEITVQDYGEGMDPDFLPYVFHRFRQENSSRSRRHGGLGLGLSIVRHIMEAHGGSARVESAGKGQGARFTVRLPQRAIVSTPPTPSKEDVMYETPQDTVADFTGVKVLVVDDQEDARMLLKVVLEHFGADVTTAASASEALHHLAEGETTVLLSDISMPDMDGYELIRRIRAQGLKVPAAALTAHARREERQAALAAGYDLHVNKPVESADLIATMRQLVAMSQVS